MYLSDYLRQPVKTSNLSQATKYANWLERIVAGKGKNFWFIQRGPVLMWFDNPVVRWLCYSYLVYSPPQSADINLASVAKGSVNIDTCTFNRFSPIQVEVVSVNESYILKAPNAEEMNEWMRVWSEEKQKGLSTLPFNCKEHNQQTQPASSLLYLQRLR